MCKECCDEIRLPEAADAGVLVVFGGKSARVKIWPARGIGGPYILKDENITWQRQRQRKKEKKKDKDKGLGGHTF